MRVLLSPARAGLPAGAQLAAGDVRTLADLYAEPEQPAGRAWVRSNMVGTLDGAAWGADGRSGSINTAADVDVFAMLRARADAVLVGAGTVRAEGYGPVRVEPRWDFLRRGRPEQPTLVVVSASGRVPPGLTDGSVEPHGGPVLLACGEGTDDRATARARELLGPGHVLTVGGAGEPGAVDPALLIAELAARGLHRIVCEGGPRWMSDMVAAGVVDEWCGTLVPRIVGGPAPRLVHGQRPARGADRGYEPVVLLEADGALMGRWVRRA